MNHPIVITLDPTFALLTLSTVVIIALFILYLVLAKAKPYDNNHLRPPILSGPPVVELTDSALQTLRNDFYKDILKLRAFDSGDICLSIDFAKYLQATYPNWLWVEE